MITFEWRGTTCREGKYPARCLDLPDKKLKIAIAGGGGPGSLIHNTKRPEPMGPGLYG